MKIYDQMTSMQDENEKKIFPTNLKNTNTTNALLAEIRKGATLKKVQQNQEDDKFHLKKSAQRNAQHSSEIAGI